MITRSRALKIGVLFAFLGSVGCGGNDAAWRKQAATVSGWSHSGLQLPAHQTNRLKREARRAQRAGNREVCGAILQRDDQSLALCFADNESTHAHSYELSPQSVRRMKEIARATGSTIIGSFHSHPTGDARPGPEDLEAASLHSLMLIHSVRTGETKLWKVVSAEGRKRAKEIKLVVRGTRPRGPTPLPPSPSAPVPDHLEEDGIAPDARRDSR